VRLYLGVDQSLTGTGVCLVDEDCKVVADGLLRPRKIRGVFRLDYICSEIAKVADLVPACADFVSVREDYSFSSKGRAVFDLGELGGCVDLSFYRHRNGSWCSQRHYRIPPSTHKKFCLHNGAAQKGNTVAEKSLYLDLVEKMTGPRFNDDNTADAWMLARTIWAKDRCLQDSRFAESLDPEEKEALIPKRERDLRHLTLKRIGVLPSAEFQAVLAATFDEAFMVFERPEK